MLESLQFQPVDQERLERARRAARFCGEAAARAVNAYAAANSTGAWELEADAWRKRQQEAADGLPHAEAVFLELNGIHQEAFDRLLSPTEAVRLGRY